MGRGVSEPAWTVGIEEEYLIVDPDSRNLAADPPESIWGECERRLAGQQVSPEFLRSQIEIGTPVCANIGEARESLVHLRRTVAEVVGEHGLALIAASTHPFAEWDHQKHTGKARYDEIARDLQAVVRRLLICGMHVHVGIDNKDLRIDLMNQVVYFLPHLLALSTSSPFWRGQETGLRSYRLTVFDALPRTGFPDQFGSFSEYQRLVDTLVEAGCIEDGTKLWWDVRPSARYPTIEMRIADVCTRVEDALTVAALFVCLLRMLYRLRRRNQRWRVYPPSLIAENRWLAQRHGETAGLIDFGLPSKVPFADLLEEIIDLVAEDAEHLGCTKEVLHAREIVRRGTSAGRQLVVYQEAKAAGADQAEALRAVVDMLIRETLAVGD
ncbi:carboxylate-amine ligase [Oceanibacterium hippocampi]|uniref:Putative glutamate--cysteine ligase 2 n=1 Tax=Oceanibacterium hippocampi TaxID=745714 RepID=A0A1Y5SD89_9PROT|nr:carboxylate-amine ligase [Oceanibacterium hippocampi]SLN35289.1 Carboxylate-amine ligase YbdK [Oceanibacterium hippocampi]